MPQTSKKASVFANGHANQSLQRVARAPQKIVKSCLRVDRANPRRGSQGLDRGNVRRGCHFRRVGLAPARRLKRLTIHLRVRVSRTNFLVLVGSCKFDCASFLVRVWPCEKHSCKLACSSLAGGAKSYLASWLVQVWLYDKAGDSTGRRMLLRNT